MNDYTKRKEPHRDFYGWATHGKDGILNIGTPGPNGDGLVGSPLGPKEYARNELVGKHVYEDDNRIMTNEDFEFEWSQFEEGIYGINWVIDRTNL